MLSELEKFYLHEYRSEAMWAGVWTVAKALFLMLLGALIFWICSVGLK
jgi:hypothetical protein